MMKINKTNDLKNKRISALIFGSSGAGKTTLASTLEGRTLVISAESGLLSLASHNIDYVNIEGDKVKCLREIVLELMNGVEYENIFLDSLTEISQIFLEHFQQQYQERKDALVLFGEVAKTLRSFIKTIRDLTQYNIFVTALEKNDKDDMSRMIYTPNLVGSMARDVNQYFDEVFCLKVFQKEDKQERLLITDHYDGRTCKDRSGKLDKFEPANLQKILNKIRGEQQC